MPFNSSTMSWSKNPVLEPVSKPEPTKKDDPAPESNDLTDVLNDLSVAEVIELVQSGEADLDEVIAAETEGKGRKTILALVKTDTGKVYPNYVGKD